MTRNWLRCFLFFTLCLTSLFAHATDLIEVYRDALKHDPAYKSAFATYLSARENFPQARAGMLPDIELTATAQRTKNITLQSFTPIPRPRYSGSHNYNLNLTQPFFNLPNWLNVKRAKATVKEAYARYYAAAQNLMVRTAQAYFNVLQIEETLRVTKAEQRANQRQLEQAKQRFKVGLDAITSVYDAQASYDAVTARVITETNNLLNSREELRKITGKLYPSLAPLRRRLRLLKPEPADPEKWAMAAQRHNYQLHAARYAAEAAHENVGVNRAEHLPKFDLTADYNHNNPIVAGVTGNDNSLLSIGLQMTFPVFKGGAILSRTHQAQEDYNRARADLQTVYREIVGRTRQAYNSVLSGISVVTADRQAVLSTQSSYESNEAQFRVGTRTIVDVLIAQRAVYNAQRQLAVDKITYILNTLQLKEAAGIINVSDLEEINTWLNAPTAYTTVERFKKEAAAKRAAAALKAKMARMKKAKPTKKRLHVNNKPPKTISIIQAQVPKPPFRLPPEGYSQT